jgi:hypothetical protein
LELGPIRELQDDAAEVAEQAVADEVPEFPFEAAEADWARGYERLSEEHRVGFVVELAADAEKW